MKVKNFRGVGGVGLTGLESTLYKEKSKCHKSEKNHLIIVYIRQRENAKLKQYSIGRTNPNISA